MQKNSSNDFRDALKMPRQRFERLVYSGLISDLCIESFGEKDLIIVGRLRSEKDSVEVVMTHANSKIFSIRSPDYAHDILMDMGVKSFNVNVVSLDIDKIFNPHMHSFISRKKNPS